MHNWQLQEAKAHLSELVRLCGTEGPQKISVHGREKVVMLSLEDYHKISSKKPKFVDFMRKSPLYGVELDIERDRSLGREIDL